MNLRRIVASLAVPVCALAIARVIAACGSGESMQNATDSGRGEDASTDSGAGADASSDANAGDAGDASTDASLCPAGSTLLVDRRACPGAVVAPPAAFVDAGASAGDVVSMAGLDEGDLPCLPSIVCRPNDAPTMLFSDDPESPSTDGVLYADTVGPGPFRIYVYHASSDTAPRKFPVVVLNQGATDAHITIAKKGLEAPGTDYVAIGKSVAASWLASSVADVVTVPAGQRVLLDSALDLEHAAQNDLVHAIYDVTLDAKLKISIVSVGASEDATVVTAGLSLLPNDGLHDRGTFPGANVLLVANAPEAASARHLRLGDNTTELDLAGTDATTGLAATLTGNYGVLYRVQETSASPFDVAISARGGAWGGVASVESAAPLELPAAADTLATTTDAVWLGNFPAATDISLVTAGGSNLPIDWVSLTSP